VRIKGVAVLTMVAIALSSACACAEGWSRYGNARFNYWIDIPPGFSTVNEADNGDGGVSVSSEGNAKLTIWGSHLTADDFRSEAKWRADQDRADGWNVTFQKQQSKWAVWSGSKGDRIFYERAVPVCDDAVAYFRLEYDKALAKSFDPVISRLGKSLRRGKC
jgi:hypothetical protein